MNEKAIIKGNQTAALFSIVRRPSHAAPSDLGGY
jgi:hypothetical protein